jgi:hypothetical protein
MTTSTSEARGPMCTRAVSMATASTARYRWCSRPTDLAVSLRPAPLSRYRRGAELPRAEPDGLRAGF